MPPVLALPPVESQQVRTGLPATGLAQAQRIVARIRQDFRCYLAQAAIRRWVAGKPKPRREVVRVGGKLIIKLVQPHYRPRPLLPAGCPSR